MEPEVRDTSSLTVHERHSAEVMKRAKERLGRPIRKVALEVNLRRRHKGIEILQPDVFLEGDYND
jgi:hypothetical protein